MCKHILNATVSIRAPCCLKWFECHECHDEFMDHPMGSSPILTLACLSCNMLFKKDLSIFGDQDELCPHCDNRYIKEAKTNEGELFKQGMEEIVDMLEFATERNKGIKTTCELELIGTLAEDEESVVSQMSQEDIGRAEELEKRKTKLLKLKNKKRRSTSAAPGAADGGEEVKEEDEEGKATVPDLIIESPQPSVGT